MKLEILAVLTILILKIDAKWIDGEDIFIATNLQLENKTLEENVLEVMMAVFQDGISFKVVAIEGVGRARKTQARTRSL